MIFVGIWYFFLLTRSETHAYMAGSSTYLTGGVLSRAGAEVSRYFLAVTKINACFGALVALMLSAFGMPNAMYWGRALFW